MWMYCMLLKATKNVWKVYIMSKTTMNIAKTVGIGLVAGSAAMAVGTAVMQKKNQSPVKNMKKTASKAMHGMGEIVNTMESMLK